MIAKLILDKKREGHALGSAEIREFGERELGWEWLGRCTSPIKGPAGNVEFLSWWRKPGGGK